MKALNGYKTYIVAIVSILGAWVSVWNGTLDQSSAIKLTETAVLGMTIRHGIKTGA